MQYYRNADLTKIYPISEGGVRNWIAAARRGQLELQIIERDGKFFVANTEKNRIVIEAQLAAGNKYRNTRGLKTVTPDLEFYKRYTPKQIRDIIASMKTHHELPLQYSYFDGGADYWDQYANKLEASQAANILTSTIRLIEANRSSIDSLIAGRTRVNVIDIGIGNCLPVKGLLTHLLEKGVLNRYIGIDISPEMHQVAARNLEEWFGDRIKFDLTQRDIYREGFDDLLVEDGFGGEDPPMNLILLFGGTLANSRVPDDALRVINNSMWADDALIYSIKLDTPNSRRFFDFNVPGDEHPLAPNHRAILELLNIDESFYEVEQMFDEVKRARLIRVKFQVAVTINFNFDHTAYSIHLNKGDTLLVWRGWHQTTLDVINQFDRNGFNLLQASLTEDYEYVLTISRIKSDFE